MKAVILAAGVASRLRPLTENTPKCLLNIGSKNLLQRCLDGLISSGINDFVIVTGYLKEQIENYIAQNYPALCVTYIHNKDYTSTNNIYSLWLTKSLVDNQEILLLDSDILFDPLIVKRLIESPHKNCLALNKHPLGEEEIKIIADPDNKILEISKTCSISNAIGESIGIEKFSANLVSQLFAELDDMVVNKKQTNVFYEAGFENIIQDGADIYAIDTTDLFSMELDTVEDFNHACEKLPQHLR